jgi:hypothetical protein
MTRQWLLADRNTRHNFATIDTYFCLFSVIAFRQFYVGLRA